jgi:hypothetical protein
MYSLTSLHKLYNYHVVIISLFYARTLQWTYVPSVKRHKCNQVMLVLEFLEVDETKSTSMVIFERNTIFAEGEIHRVVL